jgi:hypothetical protein
LGGGGGGGCGGSGGSGGGGRGSQQLSSVYFEDRPRRRPKGMFKKFHLSAPLKIFLPFLFSSAPLPLTLVKYFSRDSAI